MDCGGEQGVRCKFHGFDVLIVYQYMHAIERAEEQKGLRDLKGVYSLGERAKVHGMDLHHRGPLI